MFFTENQVAYQKFADRNVINFHNITSEENFILIDDYCQHFDTSKPTQLDLSGCDYLDSLGLGQLMMLREKLNTSNHKLQIINANKFIKETFSLTKFDQLFEIN